MNKLQTSLPYEFRQLGFNKEAMILTGSRTRGRRGTNHYHRLSSLFSTLSLKLYSPISTLEI